MEFAVLGPLAAMAEGQPLPLRSTKQRILLAMLLSNPNAPVTQRRLIEALWEVPPKSAADNLRLYVHQLRRALGNGDRITRHPAGYAIAVHPGELDAQEFDDRAARGGRALAAGDAGSASELLTRALSLWRGPAYGDLADAPVIRQAALRLDEIRLRVTEDRITADLRLGRQAELVAELIDLAATHPFREPVRAQLMRALYAVGRQAEALEVYRETRALLVERLGIEPGPELRDLHEVMLRGEALPDPAQQAVTTTLAPAGPSCPYQGLMTFQPEQSEVFFGRAQLVERLAGLVERFPVVGVFGASGSGKSSLLRAGLLGGVSGDARWHTLLVTPTAHPLLALAGQLATLSGREVERLRSDLAADPSTVDLTVRNTLAAGPDRARVLLVVDQFEEIFTLCADAGERDQFIRALVDAARREESRTTVVLGVRADFLTHVTQCAGLAEALGAEATLLVGSPSTADMREIVVRPAAMAGLTVDADLLATVLAEVGAEPGSLPLLSHALLETWHNRTGGTLSLAAYQASGGVRGAIAQTAERVFDELSDPERQAVRQIVLRLTSLGEGTEDTRRPITRGQLDGIAESEVIAVVLNRLAEARLIVLGENVIEIAHEVLIRAWPRLHRWLSDDRANLVLHRRLTAAAHTWRELDDDPGALYRGAQLVTATAWADDHPRELNETERAYLRASQELAESDQVAAHRRARLLKRLVTTLAVLLVFALAGGGVAVWQSNEATLRQRTEQAHQLALTARQLLDTDPDQASRLSVEAYRLHADAETRGALLSTASAARRRVDLNVGGPPVFDIAVSPDGTRLASAGRDGAVTVWELAGRGREVTFTEHTTAVADAYARTVAYDDSGGLLASTARTAALTASQGSIVVWDLRTRRAVFQRRVERLTNAMAFSRDGGLVAIGTGGGPIELWDVRQGTRQVLSGHRHDVGSLAFSQDRRLLVSTNDEESPVVWDLVTGTRLATVAAERVHTVVFGPAGRDLTTASSQHGVRFWNLDAGTPVPAGGLPLRSPYAWDISAPAGDRIAVADENGLITIWDTRRRAAVETYQDRGRAETRAVALGPFGVLLASAGLGRTITVRERAVPAFGGHGEGVNHIAVQPGGRIVASAGDDATVRLWDTAGNPLAVLGDHPDRVEAIAFDPDGHHLAAVTRNHTVTIWDVDRRQSVRTLSYAGMGTSTDIAYQPDGRSLVTASAGRFRWDTAQLTEHAFPGPPSVATALEFTPDGRFLVSTDPAGGMLVWEVTTDRQFRRVATGQGDVRDVAVSPDGTLIATSGADRTVKVWQTGSGAEVATLTGHTAPARTLAFSPDGRALASAGEDRTIIAWDLAARRRTATLSGHAGPVQALAFTGDGELVSGGDDGRIIRWVLSPAAAMARICAEVGGGCGAGG